MITFVSSHRSDYAKIKSIFFEMKKRGLPFNIIVSSSHLSEKSNYSFKDIENDGFPITEKIHTMINGDETSSMVSSIGLALIHFSRAFEQIKPKLVFICGDRFDIYPAAIAASLMNIPIVHLQGGEISGTIDEVIRHSITKLSHIHFPATELAKRRILQMGEDPDHVYMVGCPSLDVAVNIDTSEAIDQSGFQKTVDFTKPYLLIVQHSDTTEYLEAKHHIRHTLSVLDSFPDFQKIIFWPNIDAGNSSIIHEMRRLRDRKDTYFYRHTHFENFIKIMSNAACLIGNSSAGIREAASFGVPVVNVGDRQRGRETNENTISVPYDKGQIKKAVEISLDKGRYPIKNIYGNGNSTKIIADMLDKYLKNGITIQKKFQLFGKEHE